MPSFIIVEYIWQILVKEGLFAPQLWAAPKRNILNRVKNIYGNESALTLNEFTNYSFNPAEYLHKNVE